jgi:hypothetical protein
MFRKIGKSTVFVSLADYRANYREMCANSQWGRVAANHSELGYQGESAAFTCCYWTRSVISSNSLPRIETQRDGRPRPCLPSQIIGLGSIRWAAQSRVILLRSGLTIQHSNGKGKLVGRSATHTPSVCVVESTACYPSEEHRKFLGIISGQSYLDGPISARIWEI